MIHIVCLTKTYNRNDLLTWMDYYFAMNCFIHIIDNDSDNQQSLYNSICLLYGDSTGYKFTYEQCHGWPNQYKLYEEIMKTNKYDFQDNDIVYFLDDDEFLWYDTDKYTSLEEALNDQFKQLECVLIPQILISTRKVVKKRYGSYLNTHDHRRNDYSTQGKAYFKYHPNTKYKFFKKNNPENGHVPWINGIRMSDVVGSGVSKTTYGITAYEAPVRLYHYHIKSLDDWDKKIKRGSAAVDHQWYDANIKNNKYYGSYDVFDGTIAFRPMRPLDDIDFEIEEN